MFPPGAWRNQAVMPMTDSSEIDRRLDVLSDRLDALIAAMEERRKLDELAVKCVDCLSDLGNDVERLLKSVADLQRREADRIEREAKTNEALAALFAGPTRTVN
jgi:hypothetical protein